MSNLQEIAIVVLPICMGITIFFMYMYYREWVKSQKLKK